MNIRGGISNIFFILLIPEKMDEINGDDEKINHSVTIDRL